MTADPNLAALAREVEHLQRQLASLQASKADAEQVTTLAETITGLSEQLAGGTDGEGGERAIWTWLALPEGLDNTQDVLVELFEWLRTVYLRYTDAARGLPECWLWHPDIVEELAWLMGVWKTAYSGSDASVRAVADWHDRYRPGVVHRIENLYAAACSLERHTGGRALPPPWVPATESADLLADWWSHHRDQSPPAPSGEQISTVETIVAKRHTTAA